MNRIIHIHAAAPNKPQAGEACNGCGACCLTEPCPVSAVLLSHREGACPAVVWQDAERIYRCQMLLSPSKFIGWLPPRLDRLMARFLQRWLAIGIGCDFDVTVE